MTPALNELVSVPPATALLEATELRSERGSGPLFSGLNLALRAGDCVWLRGANGCGKTTLLRTLAGLRPADRGRLQRHAPLRYLGHSNGLKDELSVIEGLRFAARWQGLADDEAAVLAALRYFELLPLRRRPARSLSQGQRRRASLAPLALAQPGSCWLLDEPFDALDDQGVALLCQLIQRHGEAGGATLFTSHQALAPLAGARQLQLDGARP